MGTQALILHVNEDLARRVLGFLERAQHGYRDLDEFASIALLNQLGAESANSRSPYAAKDSARTLAPLQGGREGGKPNLLAPLGGSPSARLLEGEVRSDDALFVLTNRFGPMKAGLRVLGNLSLSGTWPTVSVFHHESALMARELGFRLRAEDTIHNRPAGQRRWIGFPVGDDERAALHRFVFSFTIDGTEASPVGPLSILGLAGIQEGCVVLTEAGWRLAIAESPLIDGGAVATLSPEEAGIIREQIATSKGELDAVLEFIEIIGRSGGVQSRIGDLLSQRRRTWTSDHISAHRASITARLADLGILTVSGRGKKCVLSFSAAVEAFRALRRREADETVA